MMKDLPAEEAREIACQANGFVSRHRDLFEQTAYEITQVIKERGLSRKKRRRERKKRRSKKIEKRSGAKRPKAKAVNRVKINELGSQRLMYCYRMHPYRMRILT